MRILLSLYILFCITSLEVVAQVPDSVRTDTSVVNDIASDTTAAAVSEPEIEAEPELEPENDPEPVVPWREWLPDSHQIVVKDSSLRWQLWPNWGDYQAYRRDAISFRLGSIGREDAFHINGYGPYDQTIFMEGLTLNNPITGLPNYNLIPHRKIGVVTETMHGNYETNIHLRDYYIIKPISYLNYDESSGNYRNLEFLVAQNFTERTNLELSYWDRRGGGYYPNSGVEGSQVVSRIYHHLNDRYLIRGMYLRNQLTKDESLGYRVEDPALFIFDEFLSTPNSSIANSEFTRWDLVTGLYHRADTSSKEDAGLEILTSKNMKDVYLAGDTLSWDIRTFGANIFKDIKRDNLDLRGEFKAKHHLSGDDGVLSKKKWSDLTGKLSLGYAVSRTMYFYSEGEYSLRSDDKYGYDMTGGLKGDLGLNSSYGLSYSVYERMPTIQSLYWNTTGYKGNADLQNEMGSVINGKLKLQLGDRVTVGASGNYKNGTSGTYLTPDSSFTNSDDFRQISGTIFARFDNKLLELESSGTLQFYDYKDDESSAALLNNQDQVIWLRNSAFVKGYVFDRAAFLKIGIKTLLSPLYYQSRTFNPELSFWQGNSTYQELPPFFRLDGELSARVRRIMIVIRWENALDGIGQAGYFETAGYPMPPRRLMVGIRAQFRN